MYGERERERELFFRFLHRWPMALCLREHAQATSPYFARLVVSKGPVKAFLSVSLCSYLNAFWRNSKFCNWKGKFCSWPCFIHRKSCADGSEDLQSLGIVQHSHISLKYIEILKTVVAWQSQHGPIWSSYSSWLNRASEPLRTALQA